MRQPVNLRQLGNLRSRLLRLGAISLNLLGRTKKCTESERMRHVFPRYVRTSAGIEPPRWRGGGAAAAAVTAVAAAYALIGLNGTARFDACVRVSAFTRTLCVNMGERDGSADLNVLDLFSLDFIAVALTVVAGRKQHKKACDRHQLSF